MNESPMQTETDTVAPATESASQPTTVQPTITDASAYTELYTLPVFTLANDRAVYEAVSAMQRGRTLKRRVTGSWAIVGARPNESIYPDDETVARMLARNLLIPALGQKGDDVTEYNLSAIAWRCAGCYFTDEAAKIELAAYSVMGTEKDNDTARRWRAVTADWRTRQGRRDTSPTWGKFCEFPLALGDKVTGDGTKAVTVVYDYGAQVSTLEFYGPVNAAGYMTHSVHTGHYGNRSLSQYAYDIAADHAASLAHDVSVARKAEAVRARHAKPPAPPLVIVEAGDDADALAAELGIL